MPRLSPLMLEELYERGLLEPVALPANADLEGECSLKRKIILAAQYRDCTITYRRISLKRYCQPASKIKESLQVTFTGISFTHSSGPGPGLDNVLFVALLLKLRLILLRRF